VLGATAAKALLGNDFRVTKHRGEVIRRETSIGTTAFVPTVHPSSVLRAPDDQRDEAYGSLVADLRVIPGLLAGGPGT
jgi:uracil-DNA glycosylase